MALVSQLTTKEVLCADHMGRIVAREVVSSSDDSEDQSDKELEPDDEEIKDCIRVRDHK